jgi:hypothetical protein
MSGEFKNEAWHLLVRESERVATAIAGISRAWTKAVLE